MDYSPREMAFVELNPPYNQTQSARDYLRILFRHKKTILVTFLAVTGTVFVALQLRTPIYEAQVKLLIQTEKQFETPYYRDIEDSVNAQIAYTQSEIVKSNPVLERTVKKLRLDQRPTDYEKRFASPIRKLFIALAERSSKKLTAEQKDWVNFNRALNNLRGRVSVRPISYTNLFSISVKDFDPVAAALTANTVSQFYIIFDLEQQLAELQNKYGEKHPAIIRFRGDIDSLQQTMSKAPNSYVDTMGPASVKILERAAVPLESIRLPLPVLLLAAVSGLCLGVALAFIFEHIDPTIRSVDDITGPLNLSLLGSVPEKKFGVRILKEKPFIPNRYTKSFEDLADRLHIVMMQEQVRSMLVTAPSPRAGASLVTFNLGIYLSRNLGHKVLLIDANFRQPALHKYVKSDSNGGGLLAVLNGKTPFEKAARPVDERLSLLPAGSSESHALALLDASKIERLLAECGETYDTILIDSPNFNDFKDAELLASATDGVIVVLEAGRARRQMIKAYLSALEQKKSNLLGAILNKRIFHVPEVLYSSL
jgi:capsular exopolysaccharide synthesis family protein